MCGLQLIAFSIGPVRHAEQERFGVVRDSFEMRQLCTDEECRCKCTFEYFEWVLDVIGLTFCWTKFSAEEALAFMDFFTARNRERWDVPLLWMHGAQKEQWMADRLSPNLKNISNQRWIYTQRKGEMVKCTLGSSGRFKAPAPPSWTSTSRHGAMQHLKVAMTARWGAVACHISLSGLPLFFMCQTCLSSQVASKR